MNSNTGSMKAHLHLIFAALPFAASLAQADATLSPISQTGGHAAIARGLAHSAELLCNDPGVLASLHCASVTNATSSFDTGIAEKIIDEARVQMPRRTSFELFHLDELDPLTSTSDSFIDWITGSRGFRDLPRSAKSVFDYEPFATNNLVLFAIDSAKEGRERYAQLSVLPPSHYPQFKEARDWRRNQERLFVSRQVASGDELALLREQLKAANSFVRLCSLLRLIELKSFTVDDVTGTLHAATTSPEVAALTLLLLRYCPTTNGRLAELAASSLQAPQVIEGIALGASIHFLDLDEKLLKAAITYQGFRSPGRNLPPELSESVSYPILKSIGDVVKPLGNSLVIPPETMLVRLLATTRSLHQTSQAK